MTSPPAPAPDLGRLEELDRAASRAPWFTDEPECAFILGDGQIISDWPRSGNGRCDENAALIVAMRNALSWLVARARRAEELEGWLTWRAAWTGADGPKNKAGVPWWRSAIEGEKPPRGFDR